MPKVTEIDILEIARDIVFHQKLVLDEGFITRRHSNGGGGKPVMLSRGQQTRRQSELDTGLPHTPCMDDPRVQEQDIRNSIRQPDEDEAPDPPEPCWWG